jgi:adenosylcobinamide-phosphate synthase
MTLEQQIILAVILDLFLGDPRWLPHPVKLMGRLALALEAPMRSLAVSTRIAGVVTVGLVVIASIAGSALLIRACGWIHPWAADAGSVFLLYTGITARDMIQHSEEVWKALRDGSLPEARRRVGMICGRDTDALDEAGATRATVESVAENMVDGVIAPLFYAAIAGPVGVMAYKAVNTLDSTFGYKNERYIQFGWASARLDDLANYVPSRVTAVLVPLAAVVLGLHPGQSARIFWRDRGNHPSPNAGQAEAAVAGALGVQLGGPSSYGGKVSEKPRLGDPLVPLTADHILQANRLLLVTFGLTLVLFLGIRCMVPGESLLAPIRFFSARGVGI